MTTFLRGSHVAINGPGAGLIVVLLAGVETLGSANYVFAAVVMSGVVQVILGLFRLGKLGDLIPSAVVQGMLAAIGVTILGKQIHVSLGSGVESTSALNALLLIPESLTSLHWLITAVSVISLAILIIHPTIVNRTLRYIPAPLMVLIAIIPIVFLVNSFSSEDNIVLGKALFFSDKFLISIPENLVDVLVFPDFGKVDTLAFWSIVLSITLVSTIETLVSTKAVDKLDEFKRRSDLNKELFAVGLSTAAAGFLGGLPINTVIVRSSVNINHHAKTRMSNLYHALLILLFVFLFPFIVREIPLACLATILVYTGYKLASPRLFRATAMRGWEQLLILISTLMVSLAIDILWGILAGILVTFLIHWLKSDLSLMTFIRHLLHTDITVEEETNKVVHVDIKGIANFAILLRLINSFKHFEDSRHYVVNFSRTKLVDSTVLEFIHEHRERYFTKGDFEFVGLEVHKTSSAHPLALHVLERPMQKRLSARQNELLHFASQNGYVFDPATNWHIDHFSKFKFFEAHLLEFHRNRLMGKFDDTKWVISDIQYNDGVMMAREEHHITGMVLFLPEHIEPFRIKKAHIRHLKSEIKKGEKKQSDLSPREKLLLEHASFHIQGVGREVLIYQRVRLLSNKEIVAMHDFVRDFVKVIPGKKS